MRRWPWPPCTSSEKTSRKFLATPLKVRSIDSSFLWSKTDISSAIFCTFQKITGQYNLTLANHYRKKKNCYLRVLREILVNWYLITCIQFSLPSLEFFTLFCKIYVLIKCFLIDMTKLLQLLIASVQHFMQVFDVPSLIPSIPEQATMRNHANCNSFEATIQHSEFTSYIHRKVRTTTI